jgi:hypothetical protein
MVSAGAAEQKGTFVGRPEGQILAGCDNRVVILSPEGQVLWEFPSGLVHDAWKLPSGNILFGDGKSITEVTPEKKVVFQFKSQAKRGDAVYACQRLENGNTLVGENATARILEVDPSGKIVFSLQTQPFKEGNHQNMRLARKLRNGNYLVCQSGAHIVKEYRPTGEVVMQIEVPNVAFDAIRTPQGTTLIASLGQITEFDKDGKSIWEFSTKDVADPTITNMTGMHLLPNGNIAVGVYSAYAKDGKGCGLLEITRDKKVVWSFQSPRFSRSMMAVQVLDEKGNALEGECLR